MTDNNMLWEYKWKKSSLPGDCNPVIWHDDIVLHDGKGEGLGGAADEVGYYETEIAGDFALSCRLLESERAYYGVAISTGIMLRCGDDGDDEMLYFGLAADGNYHVAMRDKKGTDAREVDVVPFSQTFYRDMRLTRTEGVIVCEVRRDGGEYETVCRLRAPNAEMLRVGFTSAFKSVYGGVTLYAEKMP